MADGRQRNEWEHTSWVLAMLVNTAANRDLRKQKAVRPDEFNPFATKSHRKGTVVPLTSLKDAFVSMGFKERKAKPAADNTEQGGSDAEQDTVDHDGDRGGDRGDGVHDHGGPDGS